MLVDRIIEPSETRTEIIRALSMLKNKKRPEPFRRHGNIPM
jgi:propionyl-CoA carboxylase beta chain